MRYIPLLLAIALVAAAQDEHAGHQGAVAGLGTVDFANSCSAAAQKPFQRGIALLHSFGYEEARLAFNQAAQEDPSCGIALWGAARTWYHPIWAPPSPIELKQGATAIERATAAGAKTPREREYIATLALFYKDTENLDHGNRARAYERALADLTHHYPADDEGAIFHALQMVATGYLNPMDKTYKWQQDGAAILNQLLPRHQNHPGVAHYIIHATDYPRTAELGLKAARAYASIAPDSSHAQHMPSHIFTRLGLWDDSIASNLAASRSAIAAAQRLHGGGGAFDQLHAVDYLVYAYLQQGKDKSAARLLTETQVIDRLDDNQFAAAYAFAAIPARLALERHDWQAAAALTVQPAWFPWKQFRNAEALVYYAKAIGAARAGDPTAARRWAAEIRSIRKALPVTRDYDWSGSIDAQLETAEALIAVAEGKKDEGILLLRAAANHEDSIDKHPVTPGALLPARELLADVLMENGNVRAALTEYVAVLKSSPRRFNATEGAARAAAQSGDTAASHHWTQQLLDIASGAEVVRPGLAWARSF